jgi:hypothetical protein
MVVNGSRWLYLGSQVIADVWKDIPASLPKSRRNCGMDARCGSQTSERATFCESPGAHRRVESDMILFCSSMFKSAGGAAEHRRRRRHPAMRRRQTACKPGSVPVANGGRWPFIWDARYRTPRATDPDGGAETRLPAPSRWMPACRPYLVLLPVGFTVPSPSPATRCALTAPFHPCRRAAAPAGGLLSVALSLGSPPPGVTRHRVSVEPGLSSPAALKRRRRPSGRLAQLMVVTKHDKARSAAIFST